MPTVFRVACAIAQADQIERAQRALLKVPVGPDFRRGAERFEPAPPFATFTAVSADGTCFVVSTRPVEATAFDPPDYRTRFGTKVEFLAGKWTLPQDDVLVVLSHSNFHYTVGSEDLMGKLAEHVAHVLAKAGLRRVDPQPADVPQLEWSPPPAADLTNVRPLHLPNGRFALVRDKYIDKLGDLVIHAEYWRDEADFLAHPDDPREAHDHGFTIRDPRSRERRPIVEADDLRSMILGAMIPCQRNDGHRAVVGRERHAGDPFNYLGHPHVKTLEVTP
jgi:hypothetical protein